MQETGTTLPPQVGVWVVNDDGATVPTYRADQLPRGTVVETFGGRRGKLQRYQDQQNGGAVRLFIWTRSRDERPAHRYRHYLHDDETVRVVGGGA